MEYLTAGYICLLLAITCVETEANVVSTSKPIVTLAPLTSTMFTSLLAEVESSTGVVEKVCKNWDRAGTHTCAFVCGLNDQWYPKDIWGRRAQGYKRCETPGEVVDSQCPYFCIEGQWLRGPCKYCCQDYSANHCDFSCEVGLEIEEGCDPFNGTLSESLEAPSETTTPREPECQEGDRRGEQTCSFICGLHDQWYPKINGKDEIPDDAQKCTEKGSVIEGECPYVCVNGNWQMLSCPTCCEDYEDNPCGIACHLYLFVEKECDPFSTANSTESKVQVKNPDLRN